MFNPKRLTCLIACVLLLCDAAASQSDDSNRTSEDRVALARVKQLAEPFVGQWSFTGTINPNRILRKGATVSGNYRVELGPGQKSLIINFEADGTTGPFSGHGIIHWDSAKSSYTEYSCDSISPTGCGAFLTGVWKGADLVFTSKYAIGQRQRAARLTYTKMAKDSFELLVEYSWDREPFQREAVFKYSRVEKGR